MSRPRARSLYSGFVAAVAFAAAALTPAAHAGHPLETAAAPAPVKIKLATVAPKGSSYYKGLQTIGERWKEHSGGAIQLVVYGDSTQGGETDVVKKMRTDVLGGALLTVAGLGEIEPKVTCLQNLPMMFRDLDEVEHVREALRPKLEEQLAQKGYVALFWSDVGFVRFFTTKPLLVPEELKTRKLFVWAGDADQMDLWRKNGVNPVSLEATEIVQGLQTGLIDTVSMPPLYALAIQADKPAPHMLDINWAPLVGAAVVTRKAWDQVAPAQREGLLEIAREVGRDINAKGRGENDAAIAALVKRGVKVHSPTPEQLEAWRAFGLGTHPSLRDRLVPAAMIEEVGAVLAAYRAERAAAPR
ncbi:MAG: C4-dicarboxylate ABC transporter substrate-binding protein [Planctomycetes bacterium]|nr:C4-dicarboxylate ABC transporter substrate-binding protein [Planctomycetota bacterium]